MLSRVHREPADLHVTVDSAASARVVRVDGEIDMSTAPALERTLLREIEAGDGAVELDLANVGFFGSEGVRLVTLAARQAAERGVRFAIVDASESVRRVLEVLELDGLLDAAG